MIAPSELFGPSHSDSDRRVRLEQVGLFFVAFLLAAFLIRFSIGERFRKKGEVLTEKLSQIMKGEERYDVLFLGNSHIYRSIQPAEFDRRLLDLGEPLQSYNAGVMRMFYLEADKILDELIAADRFPRYVLLEPSLSFFDPSNWCSERQLTVHTWPETREAVGIQVEAFRGARNLKDATSQAAGGLFHIGSFAAASLNYGALSRWLMPELDAYAPRTYADATLADQGYLPLERESDRIQSNRHRDYEVHPKCFDELIDKSKSRLAAELQPPAWQIDAYTKLLQRISNAGAIAVMVATPRFRRQWHPIGDRLDELYANRGKWPAALDDVVFLDFRHGNGYDHLYQPSFWFDEEHMTESGAKAFSQLLAGAMYDLINSPLPVTHAPGIAAP